MAVDAYFAIYLIVECIFYSFHLSILLLVIVKRKDKFEGPFYNIFRTVLVADFFIFLVTIIIQKISLIPYFINFYISNIWFSTFLFLSTPFVSTTQFFGRFLMAFNRCSAIWFPLRYQRFWKRRWYTVLLIFVAFLSICWRLHEPMKYLLLPNGNIAGGFSNAYVQPMIRIVSLIVLYSTTIAAAIFNGLAIVKFYYNKSKSAHYVMKEQHLLYMSVIIFIAQFLRASLYLLPSNEGTTAFLTIIIPILNDVLALSGSVSFLLLSKIARNEFMAFYFNKNYNTVLHSTTPNFFVNPTIT